MLKASFSSVWTELAIISPLKLALDQHFLSPLFWQDMKPFLLACSRHLARGLTSASPTRSHCCINLASFTTSPLKKYNLLSFSQAGDEKILFYFLPRACATEVRPKAHNRPSSRRLVLAQTQKKGKNSAGRNHIQIGRSPVSRCGTGFWLAFAHTHTRTNTICEIVSNIKCVPFA